MSSSQRGCLLHMASKQGGWGTGLPRAIPLQSSAVERIYSSFPKALLALLWFCLFSVAAGIQMGELCTYQSISVVKRDLSAGCAAGISQVGVGVVDRESTQTWQGEKDTAEAVCWCRTESRNAATDTAGGSGSVSFWGSVRHWAHSGCALAMPGPWGHLLLWDSTLPPATVLPQTLLRRSPGPAFGQLLASPP